MNTCFLTLFHMFRKGVTCSQAYILVMCSLPSFLYISVIYMYVLLVQLNDGLVSSVALHRWSKMGEIHSIARNWFLSGKQKPSVLHFWHLWLKLTFITFTLVIQSRGTSHNCILLKKRSCGKAGNCFVLGGINWEHCHQVTYQNLCDLLFCLQKRRVSGCPYDVLVL